MPSTRTELEELTRRFTEAFNRNDLDEVMSFFAQDGVYEEFDGRASAASKRSARRSCRGFAETTG